MKKVIDYKTIESKLHKDNFDRMVNDEIKLGWQPLGGAATRVSQSYVTRMQAMVRYEETPAYQQGDHKNFTK